MIVHDQLSTRSPDPWAAASQLDLSISPVTSRLRPSNARPRTHDSALTGTRALRTLAGIKNQLGTPYYEGHGVLLYRADCLEALRALPDATVDLTVTSPPYNIGKEYETALTTDEYIRWCANWLAELYRVSRQDGALWLNLGYVSLPPRAKAIPLPYLLWEHCPFHLLQEVVWAYGAGVSARLSFSPRNEKFLWYVKDPARYTFNLDDVRDPNVKYPNQKKNGKLKCNPSGKNPGDVWQFPKVTSGTSRSSPERTAHPAQFPVAVIERIVRAASHRADLVFDPFIGSGTTADVAVRLGRYAVGFDVSSKYLDIAIRRVQSAALLAAQAALI